MSEVSGLTGGHSQTEEWEGWGGGVGGRAQRHSADTCQKQRGLGGQHPASHSPRLLAPDINHCIRETMHKTAPTRAMKNY